MIRIILFLMLTVPFWGCGLREREKENQKKEAALIEKEQQLNLKEQTLLIKEQELLQREKLADSLPQVATIVPQNNIAGSWNVKMTCTATTCPGSAVGDSKSEVWVFSFQDNILVAQVKSGERLVRVYTGSLTDKGIELKAPATDSTSGQATRMEISLNIKSEKAMEGQREIIRENDCKITYALQLVRQ